MSSARRLYRLHLALALLGLAAVAGAIAIALTRLRLAFPGPHDLLAACRGIVPPAGSSPAMLLVPLLAALGIVVAGLAARSVARQVRNQRRFGRALSPLPTAEVCGHRVTVIASRRPLAFCAGFLRPRIYVSQGALEALTAAELRAVIAHEAHHRARRDPLRILLIGTLGDALFFLPALRRLGRRYGELAELAADEFATTSGDPRALASALLSFGERGEADAVVGIAPERVHHLLGEPPRWHLPALVLAGSLLTLLGLVAVVVTVPALVREGSVSLATVAAEGCMVMMATLPIALAVLALNISRAMVRRVAP